MAKKKKNIDIEPEAPNLLKQIKWFEVYGRKNWKLIVVATIFLGAFPLYDLFKQNNSTAQKSEPLGIFNVTFTNHLSESIRLNNPGEFYIHAPETPATNRQVSAGLIDFEFPHDKHVLEIEPSDSVTLRAALANEGRLLQYLDTEEYFGFIVISASPRPIHEEILFRRDIFKKGIKIAIDETRNPKTNIQK